MGEVSENIKASFANILHIYEETASLFLDADDLMERNGYKSLRGAALEAGLSRSLDYPNWWALFSGVRYYISEDDPWVAKSIAVFFLDARQEAMDPIIVFSSMRGKRDEDEDQVNPSWVLRDAWTDGIQDQTVGVEHTFENIRKVERGKLTSLYLEEIVDRTTLELAVINPLLELDWK
jgi:hypothetical protein